MTIIWLIYKTTNTVTGKIYVGQHKTGTVDDGYLGSGKIIRRAIKKYGDDAFTREILEICGSKEEANTAEEKWITKLDSTNKDIGYNITPHAYGGQPLSNESRQKISEKMKGRKLSEETKEKMRKPKPPRSDEHTENQRKSRIGKRWYHNPISGDSRQFQMGEQPLDWVMGRPEAHMEAVRTDSANNKRSISGKQKVVSDEVRLKISKSLMGHSVSNETKQKISQSLKEYNNEKTCNN